VGSLDRIVERGQYSELRRRIIRRAMRPLFRIGDARLTLAGELPADAIRRILVCRPNHRLGNLLLLTPLLGELERLLPNAEVDIVLAGDHVSELFRAFPNVGHIWNLSRRMVRHPVALGRTIAAIRRAHYDLAIDPCESSQSSRFLMTVARPRHALGVQRSRTTDGPDAAWMKRAPAHMAQWPVHLLRGALRHAPAETVRGFPALDIRLTKDERGCARKQLDRLAGGGHAPGRAVVGVFAEATGAKHYGADWWQRFIDELRTRRPGHAIVEIAPPDGRPRLAAGLPFFSSPSPREVAAFISNLTCFVSADCGVMHLASASGIPTLGLFSASDILKYAPCGNGSRALVTLGKTPEEVARTASAWIATFVVDGAATPCERQRPSSNAGGGSR
jgi:ADP-heptose:LPS heptosyltransferase